MSVKVSTEVWDHAPYSGTKLIILLALADSAHDTGLTWPSQANLAKKARCTEQYVRRCLKAFEEDGWVVVTKEAAQHRTKNYHVRGGTEFPSGQEARPKLSTPQTETLDHPDRNSEPSRPKLHPLGKRKEPLKKRKEPSPISEKQFDEFWEIYPRKVGKPQAKKAFKKALQEISLEEILSCTKEYQQQRRAEDPKFTKHPATFLNAKPWLDEPAKVYDPDWWLNNPKAKPVPYGWDGIED
jgi:hypothetical protein